MSFQTSRPTPPRPRAGVPLVHPDHAVPPAGERRGNVPTAGVAEPEAASPTHLVGAGQEMPALERWLQVLLVALVPAIGAIWAPTWRLPLIVAAAVLSAASIAMLVQQERRRDPRQR